MNYLLYLLVALTAIFYWQANANEPRCFVNPALENIGRPSPVYKEVNRYFTGNVVLMALPAGKHFLLNESKLKGLREVACP